MDNLRKVNDAEWRSLSARIGRAVLTVLRDRGMSKQRFAELMGYSQPTVSTLFNEALEDRCRSGPTLIAAEPEEESLIVAKAFAIIHRQLTESKALIEKLEKRIKEDAPNVKFAKDLLATQNGMSIGEAAKLIREATGIELGQNRFYCYLLDRGYLHKGGSQRGLPVQRCIETGILSIQIRVDGTFRRDVTQVTAKGLQYFINRFNRDREFLNFLYPEGFAK